MPFRTDIPDNAQPLDFLLNQFGSKMLTDARSQLFRAVYTSDTTLSPREREGMRIIQTAIMGCPVCNAMRLWRDYPGFPGGPIEEEFYQNALDGHWDWDGFSTREKLAIRFSDKFANDIHNLNDDDDFWDAMHANFSPTEIGDMCVMCGAWVGTGHTLKAMGLGSVCTPNFDADLVHRLIHAEAAE